MADILTDEETSKVKALLLEFADHYFSDEPEKRMLELHDRLLLNEGLLIVGLFLKCNESIDHKIFDLKDGCYDGPHDFEEVSKQSKYGEKALLRWFDDALPRTAMSGRREPREGYERFDALFDPTIHPEIFNLTEDLIDPFFERIVNYYPELFI